VPGGISGRAGFAFARDRAIGEGAVLAGCFLLRY
jgi:hypothetical protein